MCFVVLLEIHLLLLLYYYIIGYTSKLIAFTMYALFLKLEELVCPQTSKISKKTKLLDSKHTCILLPNRSQIANGNSIVIDKALTSV